jgi:hypothetical protein
MTAVNLDPAGLPALRFMSRGALASWPSTRGGAMRKRAALGGRTFGLLALASFLFSVPSGCGVDISFTPTNTPPHPTVARTPEQVEVHRIAPNDRAFVEIGVLDETGCWGDGTEKADRLLRRKAADIGCEALVIQGYVQGGSRYRAICLVYKN